MSEETEAARVEHPFDQLRRGDVISYAPGNARVEGLVRAGYLKPLIQEVDNGESGLEPAGGQGVRHKSDDSSGAPRSKRHRNDGASSGAAKDGGPGVIDKPAARGEG